MAKTIVRRPSLAPLLSATALPPLLQRLYAARGVATPEELEYSLSHLLKPTFKGLPEAVEILADAIMAQARVLIVGDFDADGATSSALAVMALKAMGLEQVDFLVPNRFEYGYGLTPEIVAVAAQYHPDIILTVDNGISSIEGVNTAHELGIAVVVTDHHLPGEFLPNAEAIVNPNQPGCPFPSKNLAGVGVIFYVMNALRSYLREQGWFVEAGITEPNMASFLDLVALGTVADVVPLDRNNRILVSQGLARMRSGHARPGINALCEIANRDISKLVASDLGFAIGPRLNAAGRLDDMSLGVQCLMTDSINLAREISQQLDEFNRDRKAIEAGMQQEALKMLAAFDTQPEDALPWGVCLFEKTWHQGVIGILASRIKDRLHRPTIVFADVGDGLIKGSARSIPGVHIRDVLDAVAAKYPHLLQKFGGHAMAAGMSLASENFADFAKAFDEEIRRQLRAEDLQAVITSDGELAVDEISLDNALLLKNSGPWGQHFPEPLFEGEFYVVQQRVLAERHLKLTLATDIHKQQLVDAIAFNIDASVWPNNAAQKVRVAYKLDVNEFRGNTTVQLMLDYVEAVS
jgi:single-stranded-DNA-specific exonuclease